MKNAIKILVLVLMVTVLAYTVSAVNLGINYVKVNDEILEEANGHSNNLQVNRGEDLKIKVSVTALADVTEAQIEADIYGYRYSSHEEDLISDTTETFDLDQNDTTYKTLNLQVPTKMDKDYFKLRIRVADRDGISFEKVYELHVKGVERDSAVEIKDFTFNPQDVVAGRAFTAIVKVRNIGDGRQEDLKLTMSIPELNIQTSEYMDELDADESKSFEELLLRIPETAKDGDYTVQIKVEFDEYEETTATGTIHVKGSTEPANGGTGKTTITVPGSQEVSQGTGVVYPIMITNSAGDAKTYTVTASGVSGWGTSRFDPSSVVVVAPGETKTVYMYVSANPNAELGQKSFTITVDANGEQKQIPLTANVVKGTGSNWDNVKKGLQIGLVVLVIILIILGLIIGFNKLREGKESEEETQTYY